MTPKQIRDFFDKESEKGTWHKFEDLKNKRSKFHDVHAFLMLEEVLKSGHAMVAAAEHDQIYLEPTIEQLAKSPKVDEAFLIDLMRCGVHLDDDNDSLAMFV